ncbi:hypothetical protein AGMMS49936_11440 [Endomicrobiia bacterium]|nr:hypothetical protein AGMMS49936_11440 [Endomicrobiia bacterium]
MKRSLLVFCSFFALSIFVPAVAQALRFDLERTGVRCTAVPGTLIEGNHEWRTLENYDFRNKDKTLRYIIPEGTYDIVVDWSPRKQRDLPRLLNVPDRDGILIHTGNVPEDSKGCVLVYDEEDVRQIMNLIRGSSNSSIYIHW